MEKKEIRNILEEGIEETKKNNKDERKKTEDIAKEISSWLVKCFPQMYGKKEFFVRIRKPEIIYKNQSVILEIIELQREGVLESYKVSVDKDTVIKALKIMEKSSEGSNLIKIIEEMEQERFKVEINWGD